MSLRDELREDVLDLCFDTEDFARTITHVLESNETYELPTLKRIPYEEADPGASVSVMSSDLQFRVPLDLVREPFGPRSRIAVDGKMYKVRRAQPDSVNVTTVLHLTKA